MTQSLYVLVGGWPASGKSTLAAALADRLRLPLLSKDEIKEALIDSFGHPEDVEASQRLGRAAVTTMLRVARGCPTGAVLDSTWFPYTLPMVRALPGRVVEVRCIVPKDVARTRYRARESGRHPGHLDSFRSEDELWGRPVSPLEVGPLIEVDTSGPVDAAAVARIVLASSVDSRSGRPS